ncbi:hypothetical protein [Sphingobium sp. YR768]|uniref:hypothetical protein n=1 Tax=Sphingobium sp. YR768 TaxID=1884365 RepID=UPI0008D867B0|nr:hypothetical protein [Sphingobium sp. YR768]SER60650.1 hypothetical protein SAMN05518866_114100 [Sphingobium sp. YR768]
MAIIEFENGDETTLILVVEPWGDRHEVPHLARVGLRYVLSENAEDRSYSVVSERKIELWCNADSYDIDIVFPSPCDMLMWDICVRGGWCGGIVDGKPVRVDDLIATSGTVTAEDFARLAVRADGGSGGELRETQHLRWLEAKFVEHLGGASVDAAMFRRTARRPFEGRSF